jgi:ABC-type uncharacterized transport system substrate-binding protein
MSVVDPSTTLIGPLCCAAQNTLLTCYTGGSRFGANMKRREFITLLGSVAAGWPVIARAQQGGRVPLVCILEGVSQDTPNADARYTAFAEGLLGSGFVESLSKPGANATGFMMFEYNLCAKWLELLKEIAPSVTHAVVLRDAGTAAGIGQFAVIQSVAPSVGVEVSPIDLRGPAQIERVITTFAQRPNGGIILTAGVTGAANVNLIIAAAARYKLPAIYIQRPFVAAGGLISYGPNFPDQYRRAAEYVSRILKGEKPADLPVQAPNKYELAINLKTAKALGLDVPSSLLARADEVIE